MLVKLIARLVKRYGAARVSTDTYRFHAPDAYSIGFSAYNQRSIIIRELDASNVSIEATELGNWLVDWAILQIPYLNESLYVMLAKVVSVSGGDVSVPCRQCREGYQLR